MQTVAMIGMHEWTLLHAGALGDLALAMRFTLRHARPASLTLIARAEPGDLSGYRPSVRKLSPESVGTAWLFGGDGPAPEYLAEPVCGRRVLSFLGPADSPVHARLTQLAPERLIAIDPRPRGGVRHIQAQWRDQWIEQGGPAVNCHRARSADTLRTFSPNPANDVLIHPGSGGRDKCWPLDCFTAVADRLTAGGRNVRWTLGEVELERWPRDTLDRLRVKYDVRCGGDLAQQLTSASVLLGNDSGPAHLAALLGRPTVALFGPTDARVWAPPGSHVRVLRGDVRRADWGLSPDEVAGAVLAAASD